MNSEVRSQFGSGGVVVVFECVLTLLLHRKQLVEVHRAGEELGPVPKHTPAKSRNQGLREKRGGR